MSSGVELEGFDELQKELQQLADKAQDLDGENKIEFGDLFDEVFMQNNTDFGDIDDFFDESPWNVETEEDFEAIPGDEFDKYVAQKTRFSNWDEMVGEATTDWAAEQFGL